MAYRYINAVPMSAGASVANVLSSFYKDLRAKERERQDILNLEQVRQNALAEQLLRMREKPLEIFRQQFGIDEKSKAEIEKIKAETSKTRAEAASKVWDRSAKEKEADLNKRIRELELANQYYKYKSMLDKQGLDLKIEQLRKKYADGPPSELDEFTKMIKHFEAIEKDLLSKRENVRNDDDELFAEYTERIKKLRKQVSWLRDNHPYGKLVDSLMPAPPEMPEKGPGFLSKAWDYITGVGGEISHGKVTGEKPETPPISKIEIDEPQKPKGSWKGWLYSIPKRFYDNEIAMDYLIYWVKTHPDDKAAMRKYRELRNDPNMKWYFEGKSKHTGPYGTAG